MKTILASVHGNIHGVGFKAYIERCALEFNISGYVQNEEDGTMTIKANGEDRQIMAFMDKVKSGNGFSVVDFIAIEVLEPENLCDFKVIY